MVPSVSIPEGKYEFLVILPDKPGVRQQRLEVRTAHFNGASVFEQNGIWKMGGGLLNSVPKDDQPENLDFYGSAFVVVASSIDEAREQFKNDIYATSGVWDMNKMQIYPFRAGFRNP